MNPVIKKSTTISPIWIVPIIAAIICGSLFYQSYKNAGITVHLSLQDANGITAGKTKVMVRGIPVGVVERIRPDLEQARVDATITLDAQVKEMLVEDTVFWVVRPQFSASSISGLETILSGSYINIQPGNSRVAQRTFIAAEKQPPPPKNTPGLHLVLSAKELGSLQTGSGIYYKNIQIGTVEQTRLIAREDKVELQVLIEPAYAHLVREGSRFYKASGVQVKGSLSSFSLKVGSMAALIRGGIELFTPELLMDTPLAKNNAAYSLYADFAEAEYGLPMTLRLNSSEGIVEGSTKVIYRGLVAGVVKKIELDNSENPSITAYILLDPRAKEILRENSRFWLVKPELGPTGAQNLRLFITGSYITFAPGDGKFCNHFDILPAAPSQIPQRPGRLFHLHSTGKAQVASGVQVYFKNIPIGEVVAVNLDGKSNAIITDVFIYQDYLRLINSRSLFWVESGIHMKASLAAGLSVETGPLSSMLFGGIAVSSPPGGEPVKKDQNFALYADYAAALTETGVSQEERGESIFLTAENAGSLTAGSPVLLKNIQIGTIKRVLLQKEGGVKIEAVIDPKYRKFITGRSRFYRNSGVRVHAGLDGVDIQADSLLTIAAGGISCINLPQMPARAKNVPWKLYDNLEKAEEELRYFPITIQIPEVEGIRAGSAIFYRGVAIGELSELYFTDDMQKIIARAKIEKKARNLFRAGTMIWAEQPKISLGKVEHARALLLGPDLAILPGSGELSDNFLLLTRPPLAELANASGMGIVLETTHLGSISIGSPVYYRQVRIGRVTGYELSSSFQKVQIFVSIKRRFQPLIRTNTRFWNASGIRISGGLFSGIQLTTESLAAIANGGIALATPNIDGKEISSPAKPGQHFPLHEKPEEEWLDWQPDIKIFEKEDAANYLQSVKQENK